ncbi:hypothetical protein [Aliivibrio kagoshimensis]|uniref:hypothetical protein n=1 Tax=Aliivibrio kagoshimensis TaxID=2910230 RepID=UPI003D132167
MWGSFSVCPIRVINGGDAANTLIHEGTHASIDQGRIGDKGAYEEQYAGLVGNYAEDNFKFALENYGLGDYKSGDVNKHIDKGSSLFKDNNLKSIKQKATTSKSDIDHRYLTKREYEMADNIAAKSDGKYSAEQIRNVMRHTKAKEGAQYSEGVSPYIIDSSLLTKNSFVDGSDGKLIVATDSEGHGRFIVQDMESIPLDESAKEYLLDKGLGFSFFEVPEMKVVEIDFRTGRPIDSTTGTYQLSQTVGDQVFGVSYHPCATAECKATNSNMVKNDVSDAFIDATSAKALDDVGTAADLGILLSPAGAPLIIASGVGFVSSTGQSYIENKLVDGSPKISFFKNSRAGDERFC